MAFPKKIARKIVVNGNLYEWVASGNDGFIALIIGDSAVKGQKLLVQLDYHSRQEPGGTLRQGLAITPAVVERVIAYGLARGWTPKQRMGDLNLYAVDDQLGLAV